MIKKKGHRTLALLAILCLSAVMLITTAYADSPAAAASLRVTTAQELQTAITTAAEGDTITIAAGNYEIDHIALCKGLTLQGETGTTLTVKPNSPDGFHFPSSVTGTITLKDLTILSGGNNLALVWLHNTESGGVNVVLENCTLINSGGAAYSHAVSFEDDCGGLKYYFRLTVRGCSLTAGSYCIGSGLHNGNPDVSSCSLSVSGTVFNEAAQTPGIYGIHAPKAFEMLAVDACRFLSASGGIKYIFTTENENNVSITNNDFTGCNPQNSSSCYAIMASNMISDLNDAHCYAYATHLSGNLLRGQNIILGLSAPLEVIWFPDGQAVNASTLNNLGDQNTTDETVRYARSNYGGNKSCCILTDFAIGADRLSFLPGGSTQSTSFYYNTVGSSGAYTNDTTDFAAYFTAQNPRRCSGSLTNWSEANAITRWTLDGQPLTGTGMLTAENSVAAVTVDPATGKITVTPKAVGTAELKAVVGAGTGTLPNAKADTLSITVSTVPPPYIPSVPVTPPEKNPDTGGSTLISVAAAGALCAILCAVALCKRRS